MSLASLSPEALTAKLVELRSDERRMLIEFLRHLAEVDRRELYLELGYSSLFAFCTDHLRLTRSAAFRRTTACRLLAKHPDIADYLGDGRLCLTTLVELRNVLDDAGCREILDRASGMTEDEVKLLVATLTPQSVPAPMLRKLPSPVPPPAPVSAGPALTPRVPPAEVPIEPRRPAPRVEPISHELRLLRVAVSAELAADLEKVKSALSHKIPDGDLEKVLHECIRVTLEACDKRRRGSLNPRPIHAHPNVNSRHIPAHVKRTVWTRDGGSCTFVGSTGHRCNSTHQVEFHHVAPFGKGGETTSENLTLLCARHNGYRAKQDYGSAHMARFSLR
jgi:hypothetical protein